MKILHINCNYIGTTLHQLMIENLDSLGFENNVFVPTYDKNIAVIKPNDNVCVSECFNKWDRLVFDYKQRKIIRAVEENYDVKSFDLIHAYTLFTDGNCARYLSEKYGVPYVVAVRNTDVNAFFAKMVHLRSRGIKTMLGAEKVFFLSEAYRKQVFEKYVPEEYKKLLTDKTEILPNGIDDFWFENQPLSRSEPGETIRLVYAGRIDKNKNIPTTQKAMKLLREKGINARLTVVGKVDDKSEFEKIKKDELTEYLPAKPKEELIQTYRANDIFVMPSFTESFGLVYVEAMSQGLPVIYSKGQGFDGQFENGKVGYAVKSDSAEEICEAVIKIINNYSAVSEACLQGAKRFNWCSIVNGYGRNYREIAEKND